MDREAHLELLRRAWETLRRRDLEARGRASGIELSGVFAQVVTVRDGRIVRLMNFLEIPDAFEEMARLLRQASS